MGEREREGGEEGGREGAVERKGRERDFTMNAIYTIYNVIFALCIQSEAEVKAQKQQLAKKVTPTSASSATSPPRQPTAAREEATDSGSTQQLSTTSTSGDHSSQPVATASPDGLRQRSSSAAASNSPETFSNTNNFSSMVSAATRQSTIASGDALTPVPSRGWGSLILMWVLLIAIALLVARRVYATYYGPSSEQSM